MDAVLETKKIWNAILGLPIDNRRWLSERLIENVAEASESEYISKEEILAGIDSGLKDMVAGRGISADELSKMLHNGYFD